LEIVADFSSISQRFQMRIRPHNSKHEVTSQNMQ